VADIEGGKGLRGPNSEQDALRDTRRGTYDHGRPSDVPTPEEARVFLTAIPAIALHCVASLGGRG
jgi:hypothetical protein